MTGKFEPQIIFPDPRHWAWPNYQLELDGLNYLQVIARVISEK